jgi:ribosomal protein S18 acetylase RimI-like enzyme
MIIRQATLADAAAIAKVRVDTWRMAYRGIIPEDYLSKMSYEESEQSWVRYLSEGESAKTWTYVAVDERGQIVGFVSGGTGRDDDPVYKSELYAIYILQGYQGRGIGRLLTLVLVERLVQAGYDSMLLWVFANNPARRFYEALGGKLVKTNQFELSGVMIDEVAYGWLNIRALLEEQHR